MATILGKRSRTWGFCWGPTGTLRSCETQKILALQAAPFMAILEHDINLREWP